MKVNSSLTGYDFFQRYGISREECAALALAVNNIDNSDIDRSRETETDKSPVLTEQGIVLLESDRTLGVWYWPVPVAHKGESIPQYKARLENLFKQDLPLS